MGIYVWGSAFRAYGSPQSFMGSEIAIDVLAAKMGMDSFDIRELNCYKESEQTTIPTGYKPDVYCLEEMYKQARPLYEAAKKRVAEKNAAFTAKKGRPLCRSSGAKTGSGQHPWRRRGGGDQALHLSGGSSPFLPHPL